MSTNVCPRPSKLIASSRLPNGAGYRGMSSIVALRLSARSYSVSTAWIGPHNYEWAIAKCDSTIAHMRRCEFTIRDLFYSSTPGH